MLGAAERVLLVAVIDRIMPADEYPSASGFGAIDYVEQMLTGSASMLEVVRAGLDGLERAGFAAADAARQDEMLRGVEREGWFAHLVELTGEGVYADPGNGGNRDALSWTMVGYEHRLPEGPTGPPKQAQPEARLHGPSGVEEWDAVVIGSGAGGGTCASMLAEAGKRVLVVERGRSLDYGNSGHRDHLRNHRVYKYGHGTGPELEGNPRVFVDPAGVEHLLAPHQFGYQSLASAVGGGTLVYGMQAWRFHPLDFQMASTYGVPDGSSLADWPISYDDLAPWYDRAEWEIGVSGHGDPNGGARSRDLPMPPLPPMGPVAALQRGAEWLGLSTFATPKLLNSVARDGRGACIRCGSCVGFACPSDAKAGSQNTVLRRAIASGNLRLQTGAVASRIASDERGRVIGVELIHDDGRREMVRSKIVVVAAAAVETARLLLASATAQEPDGLGNRSGHVGRHLQGHFYLTNYGLFDEMVGSSFGPGASIATTDFNHGNPGVIGGALIGDDFNFTPVAFWQAMWPQGMPRWGIGAKEWMRRNFNRVARLRAPVQEIPSPLARVELERRVRDSRGREVVRVSGTIHRETLRTAQYIRGKATDWLSASGAREVWSPAPVMRLSGNQHQAGTARMSRFAEDGVSDQWGRVWGHDNLFVADGSLHVTNGGYNPVLTIMALGLRVGDHIARNM